MTGGPVYVQCIESHDVLEHFASKYQMVVHESLHIPLLTLVGCNIAIPLWSFSQCGALEAFCCH